jgi:(1->4)-alpha-D-glucan 1-alpha-D-glucosylmutase
MTSPGMPDIYQGNEILDFSLVDPDNRRPVDYSSRQQIFDEISKQDVVARGFEPSASAKLHVTWKALNLRKQYPTLFQRGEYLPLNAIGEKSSHVIAFARRHEGRLVIVAAPRLCGKLLQENRETICDESLWIDTRVQLSSVRASCFHNSLTGECFPVSGTDLQLDVGKLFHQFPVALLVSEPPSEAYGCR